MASTSVGVKFAWLPYTIQVSHSTGWVASEFNCQLTWRVDFTTHKNANEVYTLCVDSWGAFGPFFSVQTFLFFFYNLSCVSLTSLLAPTQQKTDEGALTNMFSISVSTKGNNLDSLVPLHLRRQIVRQSVNPRKCRLPRTKPQTEKNTAIIRI